MHSHSGTYRFSLSSLVNKFYPEEVKNIVDKYIEVVNKLDQHVHYSGVCIRKPLSMGF